MTSRQNRGYRLQIARLRWTSSGRSISLYPSENGRCSQIIGNSEIRSVQTFGLVYHDTNGQNHGPVSKTQSFLLNGICTVILWQDSYGKSKFEKILLKHGWEKVSYWDCLFVHRQKGLFLSCVCGWHEIGWKETRHWSDVESTQQGTRFGRTNIIPWSMCTWLYSKTMQKKAKILLAITEPCLNREFERVWNRKASILWESSYFFMVLWYGGSCKEMCGAILWVGEQGNSTTLQSINSMHWWPSFQRRRNEICWRIVTSMLWNGSIMFILGTNWKAWYSMVSEQTCTIHHKMDQNMWQTPESIDFIYSSYMWIQTILLCG